MYLSNSVPPGLVLVTPPAIEPLTVADVKAHCRLDSSQGEIAPTAPTAALASSPTPGNVTNGTHRYLVTFVTPEGETEAGAATSTVTVADKDVNGQVALTAIPLGGGNVTARRVYRTAAGGLSYMLLVTLNDNSTTTYTDNVADGSLGITAPSVNTTEDPYLLTLIGVARQTCESFTKRRLITQTWRQSYDAFPRGRVIELFMPPLQSVTGVQYVDANGDTQTLSTDYYQVSISGERGRIALKEGYSWPTTAWCMDAVLITMVTGYGATRASVPAPLRQGMLSQIGHLYNIREDVMSGTIVASVPKTSDYLWTPYISHEF